MPGVPASRDDRLAQFTGYIHLALATDSIEVVATKALFKIRTGTELRLPSDYRLNYAPACRRRIR